MPKPCGKPASASSFLAPATSGAVGFSDGSEPPIPTGTSCPAGSPAPSSSRSTMSWRLMSFDSAWRTRWSLSGLGFRGLPSAPTMNGLSSRLEFEREIHDACGGDGRELDALRLLEGLHVARRNGIDEVDGAGTQGRHAGRIIGDELDRDVLESGLLAPELVVADERDVVARHPFLHLVGARCRSRRSGR